VPSSHRHARRAVGTVIQEPPDNSDLDPITLWTLALVRLTRVEVHGQDLDLTLSPWSVSFVEAALPTRLLRLPTRRSNHRAIDDSINGSWGLVATDAPAFASTPMAPKSRSTSSRQPRRRTQRSLADPTRHTGPVTDRARGIAGAPVTASLQVTIGM
jgi:hypothetical protein